MSVTWVPIVEGHGEVAAVPVLLSQIVRHLTPQRAVSVNTPIRVKASSFLHDTAYFDKYFQLAAAKADHNNGNVLILLDCDDDCPATLGPRLLEQARRLQAKARTLVVLAQREYESWFVASADSLQNHSSIKPSIVPPHDSTQIRDAKGWLSKHMIRPYDPITDQESFTRLMDISRASANPSFGRLVRHIKTLL